MSKIKGENLTLSTLSPNWAIERNSYLHQGNLVYVALYKYLVGKTEHTNVCLRNCVLPYIYTISSSWSTVVVTYNKITILLMAEV